MKITMTLTERLGEGLARKAAEFGMDVSEYLKHAVFAAAGPSGHLLKIELPLVEKMAEPELPLFEPSTSNESR